MDLEASIDQIIAIFGDGEECAIARGLVKFLEDKPATKHINLGLLRQISAPQRFADNSMLRVLQFYAGDDYPLLEIKFEYLHEDELRDITKEEARNVADSMINPFTGLVDSDSAKNLLIYFQPKKIHE